MIGSMNASIQTNMADRLDKKAFKIDDVTIDENITVCVERRGFDEQLLLAASPLHASMAIKANVNLS